MDEKMAAAMSEIKARHTSKDNDGACRETAQSIMAREIQALKDRAASLQVLLDLLGTATGPGTAEGAVSELLGNRGCPSNW